MEAANRKIESVYFVEQGIVSLVGGGKPDREVEIGIIGCEGVTGLPVIFGSDRSPHHAFVQIAGDGFRLPVEVLRQALDERESLRHLLLRFAQAFMLQIAHTAVANARGTLEQRLARWVLMAQDRVGANELLLTHEFLSLMLAVRRPGVTDALHALSGRGFITHKRGTVIVLDREGLVETAGGLYGVPEAEYERLLGRGRPG